MNKNLKSVLKHIQDVKIINKYLKSIMCGLMLSASKVSQYFKSGKGWDDN